MRNREDAAQKARELVSQMTLEEKASQLKYDAPAIPRLGIPAYNWWNEVLHGVARAGTATVFPQAIGLAAMFDEEMQEEIASVISQEARAKYNGQSSHNDRDIYKGLTVWSPNINIFRGNLRRGPLSDQPAWYPVYQRAAGKRKVSENRSLQQAFCRSFRP